MRRFLIGVFLSILLTVWLGVPACTEVNSAFPDLSFLLHTPCQLIQTQYAFSDSFTCDAYAWDYPKGWRHEGDLLLAMFAQIYGGWTWETGEVEEHSAFFLTNDSGGSAVLVSDFEGRVLVLLPVGCDIVAVDEERTEADTLPESPSYSAAPAYSESGGGHWEWQNRQVDCPACVGGWCSICNGTGSYRLYGEEVSCRIYCTSCGGLGYIVQNEYVFVPDV